MFHGIGVVTWRPHWRFVVQLGALGALLFVVGLFLFGLPVVITHGSIWFKFGSVQFLIFVGLTVGLMGMHEAVHALVMLGFGARPRFGVVLMGPIPTWLYVAARGHRFARWQHLVIAAAPAVVISVLGLAAAAGPGGALVIVPLAAHLADCCGDVRTFWQIVRHPTAVV